MLTQQQHEGAHLQKDSGMTDGTQPYCYSICPNGCDAHVCAFSHLPGQLFLELDPRVGSGESRPSKNRLADDRHCDKQAALQARGCIAAVCCQTCNIVVGQLTA